MAVDAVQTVSIAERGTETNFLLGRQPSTPLIVGYFATALAVHVVVAAILPGRWRTAWQVTFSVTQGYQVWENATRGDERPGPIIAVPIVVPGPKH